MKLLLFAALVFGLCFLVDKGISALKNRVRTDMVVRMPVKYPIFAAILALTAVGAVVYAWVMKSTLMGAAAAVLLGMSIYVLVTYLNTRIDYTEDTFTFRRGREVQTFRFGDIDCQRVAINRGGCCLVLVAGKDEIVFYSNMQGFFRFLDHAFAAWCKARQLDPAEQTWHDPRDYRWFPDDEEAEN